MFDTTDKAGVHRVTVTASREAADTSFVVEQIRKSHSHEPLVISDLDSRLHHT